MKEQMESLKEKIAEVFAEICAIEDEIDRDTTYYPDYDLVEKKYNRISKLQGLKEKYEMELMELEKRMNSNKR